MENLEYDKEKYKQFDVEMSITSCLYKKIATSFRYLQKVKSRFQEHMQKNSRNYTNPNFDHEEVAETQTIDEQKVFGD